MNRQNYRIEFKEILERTFLPECVSSEEMKEKLLPISKLIFENIPPRLFRYRPCSEMNMDAFNEDKLYALTPDMFNDPYDSLFRYDKDGLRNSVLTSVSKDFLISLRDYFRSGGNFPEQLSSVLPQELLDNTRNNLVKADDGLFEMIDSNNGSIKELLSNKIDELTNEAVKSVRKMAFIACFSESIRSVTMWSHYADSHKGFSLEYDTNHFQLRCQNCDKVKHCNKAAVCSVYPVIYHRQRYDATDFLAWYIGKGMGMPIKNPDTFAVGKCFLYKSPQWNYEKEWRLIVSKMNEFQDKSPACIYNIRPTAIYYGTDIAPINRKMLHIIAKEKGIKEYQMYIDNKSYQYSMGYKKV
jgi:hypothetical protein